jgi:hypothetical protein
LFITPFKSWYGALIFKERKEYLMSKTAFKPVYIVIICLLLEICTTSSAGAADVYDTVVLKNGDKITGTLLTDTFTITTPYSAVPLEKDKISEIKINPENKGHDVIALKAGGLVEGTIEELSFSFKTASGENITIEKKECKIIILNKKDG